VIGAADEADDVRGDQADEANDAGERGAGADPERDGADPTGSPPRSR
jgi:hypothetical protein